MPRQTTGDDCGVFVCMFADALSIDRHITECTQQKEAWITTSHIKYKKRKDSGKIRTGITDDVTATNDDAKTDTGGPSKSCNPTVEENSPSTHDEERATAWISYEAEQYDVMVEILI